MGQSVFPIPSTLTTKGDLLAYDTAPNRLPVGVDGSTLVANSASAIGVAWAGPTFAAGKNKIINGDFGIWQRGTSFTTSGSYTADRFNYGVDGGTFTISQKTFTPGSAPVSGYESQYYLEIAATTGGNAQYLVQRIEDVRVFANQTVTLSYWAKANTSVTATPLVNQVFGSGGSSDVVTTFPSVSIGTSWQRVITTVAVPTINTKTIGTNSLLEVQFLRFSTAATIDIWGVQVEAGSVATPFTTATGTVQGELAACMRYYEVMNFRMRGTNTSTDVNAINFTVAKRVTPSSTITVNSGTTATVSDNFPNGLGIAVAGSLYDGNYSTFSSAEL